MTEPDEEDPRRAKFSEICLALPEATREVAGLHAIYRVRKKTFAYFQSNHHGDGIVSAVLKTELGEHEELARMDPEKFFVPPYVGPRGWVGLRLDRGPIDWEEVAEMVKASYRRIAPKRLVAGI